MSPSPSVKKETSSSKNKKLELQTFLDLTRSVQIKLVMYLVGAIVLLMIGISGLSAISEGGAVSGILGGVGLGAGSWLGYTGYKILIDPKNEKKCNAAFWSVTENIDFEKDDYTSETGITLCKAQIKAEHEGYAGFYCVSNTETENTIDAYYITMSDSKKLTLKSSGTSNVFTIKSGDNKIKVTEPPGSFTISFTSVSSGSVTVTGSNFIRIDETKNADVSVILPGSGSPNSSPSPQRQESVSIQNLKDGHVITGAFETGTMINVTAYSTTQNGLAISKNIRLNLSQSP
jgi:hypothetical protein